VVAINHPHSSLVRDKVEVEKRVQQFSLSSMVQECCILADPKRRSHPNLPHILGVYFQEERGIQGIRPCLVMKLAVPDFRGFLEVYSREGRGATVTKTGIIMVVRCKEERARTHYIERVRPH